MSDNAPTSPMPEIIWEDPPQCARGRQPIDWTTIVQPLRAHPGRWARVRTYTSASSGYKTAPRARKSLGATFEVVARSTGGTSAIYVRYLGDES